MSLISLINSITIDSIENNSTSSNSSIKSDSNKSNELQIQMNHEERYLYNSLKDKVDALPEVHSIKMAWDVEGFSLPNCKVSPVMPIDIEKNIEKTDNDNDCKNSNIIDCDDDSCISTLSNSTSKELKVINNNLKVTELYKKILDVNDSYDEACDYIRKLIRSEKIQDQQDSQQRDKINEKVTRFYRIYTVELENINHLSDLRRGLSAIEEIIYTVELENIDHLSDLRRGLSAMEEMVRLYFEVKEIVNDNGIKIQIEVRALLYFCDYHFNTCPLRIPGKDYNGSNSDKINISLQEENNSFSWLNGMFSWMIPTTTKSENVSIDEGVMKCESSLKYINHWPRDVIIKIKTEVNKPNAAFEFATDLVTDHKNILGLEKISLDTKEKIIQKLMERGFEKNFMKAFNDI